MYIIHYHIIFYHSQDVRLMRYRAHVLHSLLAGFVQRRGFNVLFATLPPKEEHVILIRLTSFQRGLYIRFMQCFKEAGAGGWCSSNPLKAFSVGCKVGIFLVFSLNPPSILMIIEHYQPKWYCDLSFLCYVMSLSSPRFYFGYDAVACNLIIFSCKSI